MSDDMPKNVMKVCENDRCVIYMRGLPDTKTLCYIMEQTETYKGPLVFGKKDAFSETDSGVYYQDLYADENWRMSMSDGKGMRFVGTAALDGAALDHFDELLANLQQDIIEIGKYMAECSADIQTFFVVSKETGEMLALKLPRDITVRDLLDAAANALENREETRCESR